MRTAPSVRAGSLLLPVLLMLVFVLTAPVGAAQIDPLWTPWEGFAAVGEEPFGLVSNPASLSRLQKHVLRAQGVSSETGTAPGGQFYVYLEPDEGLGAGQLAYVTMQRGNARANKYVYSGSWRGSASALGFSVKHLSFGNMAVVGSDVATWSADFGYYGEWTDWFSVGLVAQNAVLFAGELERDDLPPEVAAGMALNFGRSLIVAADYIVTDFDDPAEGAYKYGLEGRLGRVLARVGQKGTTSAADVFRFAGLGYELDTVRLDATVGEDDDGRVYSLGLSLYF